MSDAPTPNWRDAGAEPSAEPAGARPWQPNEAATPEPAAGPSGRSIKRTIALLALVGAAVAFGVVIVLLRPIKPACLVLIGSGYETNLLLPHNVHGWSGMSALEKEVTQEDDFKDMVRLPWDQPTKMRRVGDRVELKDQTWKELWDRIDISSYKEKTVVVFLALHGMADKDEAYLLPNYPKKQAGKGFNATRIRFREVLDSLKAVKDKKVVLLLDLGPLDVRWPIGMLHNDFVKRLQEKYESEIKDMGNLVVICSASPDQHSWASEELQRTVFSHYVTQGLKGAGQAAKERVTALKLFKYVEEKVDKWAQTNRARNQTPLMLGTEAAADKIEIVHISEPYTEGDPPARHFEPESLRAEWNKWKDLKRDQAPQVYSPAAWRLYQETLLRYEQLQRAGDPTNKAPELKKQLDKLHADLATVRALDKAFASLGNSFPMHQVLGYRPATDDLRDAALQDLLTVLRKTDTPEERTKVLAKYKDKSPQERQYLRVRVSHLMLNEATLQVKTDRTREQERLAEGEREFGALQRASEVHLLKMIQDADPKLDDDIVTLALRVQMLAEEVALSAGADSGASELYAEVIFPLISNDVAKADALRREGQDLLFGDPKVHGAKARLKLKEARDQYEKVRAQSQQLQKALALRDEVAADLPSFAAWLAALPPLRSPNKEEVKALRAAAEGLGNGLADLRNSLEVEKKVPAAADVAQMTADLKTIREGYQNLCDEMMRKGAMLQQNWHALDSVLSIPPVDAKDDDVALRISLLTRVRLTSGELSRAGNAEGKTEEEESAKLRVEHQRKLLRASLKAYDDIQGNDKDNIDDKAREFFLNLPTEITAKADGAVGEEPDLVGAANLSREIPAGLAEQVKNDKAERLNPVDRLRRLRTYRLLHWLAERTFEDHWFEPGIGKGTYYVSAGKAYLDSARSLFDRGQLAKALIRDDDDLQRKLIPVGLTIPKDPNPHWTTEFDFPLVWPVHADAALPAGTPMVWLEVKKGAKTDKFWQPEPRKAVAPWPTPTKDYTDAFSLNKANVFDDGDVKVTFNALYRGQRERRELAFLRSEPKIIVRNYPAPDKASFAARMDSGFDYGAISIVLDNSGSMNYVHPEKTAKDVERFADKAKGDKRRFDYALDALGQVLRKIPNNTSLSIYTLGRKEEGKYITGTSEYRAPSPWRQEKQLDNLLLDLQDAPGEIASPIAEGILTSMKDGFPANFKGPKVILVLTDGDDNSSFGVKPNPNDPEVVKKHAEKIRAELKKANIDYPDVHVVMVCFIQEFSFTKEDNPEFKRVRGQFEGLPGLDLKFVPEGERLGVAIEEQVRPRVQLRVDDKPAPGFQIGQPVNYHRDLALKWNPVPPNSFRGRILKTTGNDIGVEMPAGQNIFAILKRSEKTLYLEQGVLGLQPEIANVAYQKENSGWLVSLLENHKSFNNKLSEVVVLEKTEIDKSFLRQTHPGFTWLELDALDGARPDQTLTWGKEWSVPAAAFRLEMPAWPTRRPKVSAWFWPEERERLLANDALVTRATVPVELAKPMQPEGKIAANPIIESALWEVHEVEDAAGGKTKENCLVVRVRHDRGRPVWVGLKDQRADVGSEHHYFPDAAKCTIYFYKLAKVEEINLVFIDIEGFKAAAKTVTFTPERTFRAPAMFLNKVE